MTPETSWAISSNPSTYRWISVRSRFVVRLWFLAKCAATCFGTTAVRHSKQTTIRCRREWRKYLAKISALGAVGVGVSTARPIYRVVGSWDRGSAMSCRAPNTPTVYMSAPAALFIYASAHTLSDPDLLKPKNPSTASTYSRAASAPIAPIHSWRASHVALLPPTGYPFLACVAYGPAPIDRRLLASGGCRGFCVGSGPALEHRNRPHASGGGDIISRPRAFRVLKNTRIAQWWYRVPPVRV